MIKTAIIIAGCPRSGTTLLYNILSNVNTFWSLGLESKDIIEHYHHPRTKNWVSGSLDTFDLTAESQAWMLKAFEIRSAPGSFWRKVNQFRTWLRGNSIWLKIKNQSQTSSPIGAISSSFQTQSMKKLQFLITLQNYIRLSMDLKKTFLEKTPENCLRLPFLEALFPEIKVIHLVRDGRANVHSLMEGWHQPHLFPGYQVPKQVCIPGDTRGRWAFTLIPGWDELLDRPLEEVCAWQWVRCNQSILTYASEAAVPYIRIHYEDLVNKTSQTLRSISTFLNITYEDNFGHLDNKLPQINVLSKPDPDKWRQSSETINHILPIIINMMERLGYEID